MSLLYGSSRPWPRFRPVNDSIRGGQSTSHWTILDSATRAAEFNGVLDIETLGGAGFASQSTTFEPAHDAETGSKSSTRLKLPRSRYGGLVLRVRVPRGALSDGSSRVVPDAVRTSEDSRDAHEGKTEKHEPQEPTRFTLVLKDTEPGRRPDGRRESVVSFEFEFDVVELGRRRVHSSPLWLEKSSEGEKDLVERREGRVEQDSIDVDVEARWDEFRPTYRGRPQDDAKPLDTEAIYELSFMCRSSFGLQAGPFSLTILSLSTLDSRPHHDPDGKSRNRSSTSSSTRGGCCFDPSNWFAIATRWIGATVDSLRAMGQRLLALVGFGSNGGNGRGGEGRIRLP
ncbi:hypothetical protein JCM10212_000196 [Sporobolomyces blumeae]